MNNTVTTNLDADTSITKIHDLIQQAVRENSLPGAVVHISHKGNTVMHEAFGMADRESARPQCLSDLFYLGSTSKPLAVTGILTLVDKHELLLDDAASKWMNELEHNQLKNRDKARSPTIQELLSHSSGIFGNATSSPRQKRMVWNFSSTLAAIASQITKQAFVYPPGKSFSYGGASMTVASRIAEIVSGMEFDALLNKSLFSKLDMSDTFYRTDKSIWDRFSVLYTKSAGALYKSRFQPPVSIDNCVLPAGGIISTAQDLSVFLQQHLENNQSSSTPVMNKNLFMAMRNNMTSGKQLDFKYLNKKRSKADTVNCDGYGLGWMLDEIDEHGQARVFFHGGAFGTMLWGDAASKLGIVLLTHVPLADVSMLWSQIINIAINAWSSTAQARHKYQEPE